MFREKRAPQHRARLFLSIPSTQRMNNIVSHTALSAGILFWQISAEMTLTFNMTALETETEVLHDNDTSTCLNVTLLQPDGVRPRFQKTGTLRVSTNYSLLDYIHLTVTTEGTSTCESIRILFTSSSENQTCTKFRKCSVVNDNGFTCTFQCACLKQNCEILLASYSFAHVFGSICEISLVTLY